MRDAPQPCNAQLTGLDAHAGGFVVWAVKTAGMHSGFSGLNCDLIRVSSAASAVGC
jgi:hypothetical protein